MIDFYAVKHPGYGTLIGDAVCAYFHAVQDELVVCGAPEEVKQMERDAGRDDEVVMVLKKELYGERSASIRFEEFLSGLLMNELGFEWGYPQPQFYIHRTTKVALELHQEDVHVAGPPKELEKFSMDLGKNVKMK